MGCSSDDTHRNAPSGAGGDDSSGVSTGPSSGATAASGATSGAGGSCPGDVPSCIEGLPAVAGDWFCAQTPAVPECPGVASNVTATLCGVPLKSPPAELARSTTAVEHGGTGPAQTGCFDPASAPPPPGAPQTATVNGVVQLYRGGCTSTNVEIKLWTVTRDCTENDGALAKTVGAPVTTAASCVADGLAVPDASCGTQYLCPFSYKGVPTETELVVKTGGAGWTSIYEYGIYIRNADVVNGTFAHDAVILDPAGYDAISQSATGKPAPPMHGSVFGEIRDCGGVRLENAVIGSERRAAVHFYFTADDVSPLADLALAGTGALGRFGLLDIPSGDLEIAAVGSVGGTLVPLGFTRAHVYPKSVTLVTFEGLFPGQAGL